MNGIQFSTDHSVDPFQSSVYKQRTMTDKQLANMFEGFNTVFGSSFQRLFRKWHAVGINLL